MKKPIVLIIPLLAASFLSACEQKVYKVTFDTDGGSTIAEQEVARSHTVNKPNDPTKLGYDFVSWTYNDTEWNFDEDKVKEGHVLPNKEKGQTLDKYSWGQMDIKEITINVPLPKETRAKDMDITWDEKKIKVAIKGKEPIYYTNPIRQNYGHVKALSELLKIDESKIYNIVCIPSTAKS